MSAVNKILQESKKSFIDYSLSNIERTKNYYKKLQIENLNTGVISSPVYNFENIQKDDYNNILQRTNYLQNEIVASETDFVALFITLTLPSEYHPLTQVDKKRYIKNVNYNSDLTINAGYKKLNKIMKKIQKDLMIKNKQTKRWRKLKLKFIKVIEYHKSFVPHLHSIVFVPREFIGQFKKHLINIFGADTNRIKTIKGLVSGKHVNKTIYESNENIGRTEVEELENVDRAVSYLLKYIRKSLNAENVVDKHLLDGWKKKNKIRNFTMSNVSIPRYIYKKLYTNLGESLEKNIDKRFNILEKFEEICDINVKTFFENELISERNFGNKTNAARYIITIEKEKIEKEYYKDEEIEDEDEDLDEDEIEIRTQYRLDEFIIFDVKKNKEIYNKRDYKVEEIDITENDLVDEHEYDIILNEIIKKDNQKKDAVKFVKDFNMTKNIEKIIEDKKQKEIKEIEEIKKEKKVQLFFDFDYLNDPLCHSCNIKVFNKAS